MHMDIDPAEYRCMIMMGRRTKIMGFYAVMFGFTATLLKNPDDLDAFAALYLVGLYFLISLYYLITQNRFFARRFATISAGIADETARRMIQRENAFHRVAHGGFILLSFLFIVYLGIYNG